MSFKVTKISRLDWVAEERLYTNADKTSVLSEGHKDAAILLAAKGQIIPEKTVKRYGLDKGKDEVEEIKSRQTRVEKPTVK